MPDAATKAARPSPPEQIDGEALLEWERLSDQLAADGTLAGADLSLMLIYCRTYATWFDSDRHVRTFGAVVKHHNGIPGANPHYKITEKLGPQLVLMREKILATAAKRAGAKTNSEDLEI